MRKFRVGGAAAIVVALSGLSGCKESPAVGEVLAFESAMCACKDAACADKERARIVEWHKGNRATMVSDDEQTKITEAMARAKKCLEALRPPAPVPAEAGAPAPSGDAPAAEAPTPPPVAAPAPAAADAPAPAQPRPAEE